ncbi:MAG: hypothetical protein AAFZ07_18620 [Actinomycetota bacterium]
MERRRRIRGLAVVRAAAPLVIVWAGGLGVLAAAIGQDVVEREELLLDPVTVGGLPWYTGLVSQLGVVCWAIAATVAGCGGFVAALVDRRGAAHFLSSGAALGVLLLLDDLFQLHAVLLPRWLGVSKHAIVAGYGAVAVTWIVANRAELLRTRLHLLAASALVFAASVGADVVGTGRGTWLVVEDGGKLLGILAWAAYFIATSADIVRSAVRAAADTTVEPHEDGLESRPA